LSIPWDFILIIMALGILVPWRSVVRIKRLIERPTLASSARLSLYVSTIGFQWLIVAFVPWRSVARHWNLQDLGLTLSDSWRTTWTAVCLTVLLCVIQWASLRKIIQLPEDQRGYMFRITQKIMPRTCTEKIAFVALACTAGLSEEFLYRGFVFAVFARAFENSAYPATLVAALASSALFAIGHLYQGGRGIVTTCVVSITFVIIRIWTQSLLPGMIAHSAVDLVAGLYVGRLLLVETGPSVPSDCSP
jgi:membrane protease YdiL (CAAX protease family)